MFLPSIVLRKTLRRNGVALILVASCILVNAQLKFTPNLSSPNAVFVVTNTNDSGPGSFRQALLDANATSGTDTINFSVGSGLQTIVLQSDLPVISDPIIIDGTSQPGYSGAPLIEVTRLSGFGSHAVLSITAGNSTVKGLVINRSTNTAIALLNNGGNRVEANYLGTDVSGTLRLGNSNGIVIFSSSNNVIGGTTPAKRNLISANETGIAINDAASSGNLIQGNYIGTNAAGTAALGNGSNGIRIVTNTTIGGTAPGAGNLISGNGLAGIGMGAGNVVQGNFIGTDVSGMNAISNGESGIETSNPNNLIGGSSPGARNLISGNAGAGIKITESIAVGNIVQGNLIGTAIDGTTPLPNSSRVVNSRCGVFINRGVSNVIGGAGPGEGNTIAFNGDCGVIVISLPDATVPVGVNNSIRGNSIFSNDGPAIEFPPIGITPNDACDADIGPNALQNYPMLSSAIGTSSATNVQGTLNSKASTTFTLEFFANPSCDSSGNGEGQNFIGSTTVTTDAGCIAAFNIALPFAVGGQFVTATATDPSGNTSEFSSCVQASGPIGPVVKFDAVAYSVSEGGTARTITITRTGDSTAPATVGYSTNDTSGANGCSITGGAASSRCDYLTTIGTAHFAAGETFKTISIPIIDDAYAEGTETFIVTLRNPSVATLGSPASGTITITDNETVNGANPIDTPSFFVRQHYLDFLNREPDTAGFNFWLNQITSCGADAQCIEVRRIHVSASFFLSIEFQDTGYLVERTYKVSYGDAVGNSTIGGAHTLPVPIVKLNEFLPDTQELSKGVIVGQPGWEMVLDSNKQAFVTEFVQRTRFATAYPTTLSPAAFVDALFAKAGVTPTTTDRNAAISEFGGAGNTADLAARGRALRKVAENSTLTTNEVNRAFVLMQYFGFLRRDPNDPQDTDHSGYDFWLAKLNQFNGDFIQAEMVKGFLSSIEYRQRFGP
jgi:hypothetical protein